MRKIKRLLAVMLSIIMIFSVVAPINVISFAQEAPQLELSVPDTSYFEIVTATVSAKGMSDLQSVDLELYYDADYFEFVEFTSISDGISSYAYDTADGNTNLSAVLFDNYDVDDDILFTATFKVKKSGTTEMRLVVDNWEAAQTPADTSTVVNVASSPYILIAEDNSTIEVDYFSKIVKISERTEVSDIYTSISNESVSLTDADGNSVNDTDLVATGYVLTCDTMAYTVVVPGDVDSNGKVNASDARKALRNSAMLEILTDAQFLAADIDESGTITASDARAILRISAAIEKAPEIVPAEPITSPDETTTAEPTSEEATTAEVTTVEVTTAESTTAEITTAETTTAEVTTVEVTTVETTTAEVTTEEPTTEEPTTEEPTTEEPTTEEPTTEELTTEEPTTEEPTIEEPSTEEPTTEEPSEPDDVVSEPAVISDENDLANIAYGWYLYDTAFADELNYNYENERYEYADAVGIWPTDDDVINDICIFGQSDYHICGVWVGMNYYDAVAELESRGFFTCVDDGHNFVNFDSQASVGVYFDEYDSIDYIHFSFYWDDNDLARNVLYNDVYWAAECYGLNDNGDGCFSNDTVSVATFSNGCTVNNIIINGECDYNIYAVSYGMNRETAMRIFDSLGFNTEDNSYVVNGYESIAISYDEESDTINYLSLYVDCGYLFEYDYVLDRFAYGWSVYDLVIYNELEVIDEYVYKYNDTILITTDEGDFISSVAVINECSYLYCGVYYGMNYDDAIQALEASGYVRNGDVDEDGVIFCAYIGVDNAPGIKILYDAETGLVTKITLFYCSWATDLGRYVTHRYVDWVSEYFALDDIGDDWYSDSIISVYAPNGCVEQIIIDGSYDERSVSIFGIYCGLERQYVCGILGCFGFEMEDDSHGTASSEYINGFYDPYFFVGGGSITVYYDSYDCVSCVEFVSDGSGDYETNFDLGDMLRLCAEDLDFFIALEFADDHYDFLDEAQFYTGGENDGSYLITINNESDYNICGVYWGMNYDEAVAELEGRDLCMLSSNLFYNYDAQAFLSIEVEDDWICHISYSSYCYDLRYSAFEWNIYDVTFYNELTDDGDGWYWLGDSVHFDASVEYVQFIAIEGESEYSICDVYYGMDYDAAVETLENHGYIMNGNVDENNEPYFVNYNDGKRVGLTCDEESGTVSMVYYHSFSDINDLYLNGILFGRVDDAYIELDYLDCNTGAYVYDTFLTFYAPDGYVTVIEINEPCETDWRILGIGCGMDRDTVIKILRSVGFVVDDSYEAGEMISATRWCNDRLEEITIGFEEESDSVIYVGFGEQGAINNLGAVLGWHIYENCNFYDQLVFVDDHYELLDAVYFYTDEDERSTFITIFSECDYNIYGVYWGMDYDSAVENLERNGFVKVDEDGLHFVNYGLRKSVELTLDEETGNIAIVSIEFFYDSYDIGYLLAYASIETLYEYFEVYYYGYGWYIIESCIYVYAPNGYVEMIEIDTECDYNIFGVYYEINHDEAVAIIDAVCAYKAKYHIKSFCISTDRETGTVKYVKISFYDEYDLSTSAYSWLWCSFSLPFRDELEISEEGWYVYDDTIGFLITGRNLLIDEVCILAECEYSICGVYWGMVYEEAVEVLLSRGFILVGSSFINYSANEIITISCEDDIVTYISLGFYFDDHDVINNNLLHVDIDTLSATYELTQESVFWYGFASGVHLYAPNGVVTQIVIDEECEYNILGLYYGMSREDALKLLTSIGFDMEDDSHGSFTYKNITIGYDEETDTVNYIYITSSYGRWNTADLAWYAMGYNIEAISMFDELVDEGGGWYNYNDCISFYAPNGYVEKVRMYGENDYNIYCVAIGFDRDSAIGNFGEMGVDMYDDTFGVNELRSMSVTVTYDEETDTVSEILLEYYNASDDDSDDDSGDDSDFSPDSSFDYVYNNDNDLQDSAFGWYVHDVSFSNELTGGMYIYADCVGIYKTDDNIINDICIFGQTDYKLCGVTWGMDYDEAVAELETRGFIMTNDDGGVTFVNFAQEKTVYVEHSDGVITFVSLSYCYDSNDLGRNALDLCVYDLSFYDDLYNDNETDYWWDNIYFYVPEGSDVVTNVEIFGPSDYNIYGLYYGMDYDLSRQILSSLGFVMDPDSTHGYSSLLGRDIFIDYNEDGTVRYISVWCDYCRDWEI